MDVELAMTPHHSPSHDAPAEKTITHGRHCICSACAAQDWSDPRLAPCGMHGRSCPPVYAPLGAPGDRDPTALPAASEIRTPDQWRWIRDRYKPDGLVRLARANRQYADDHGLYLPDVAAVAYAEWERAEAALRLVEELIAYSGLRGKVRLRDDPTEYVEAERLIARADELREEQPC